MFSVDQIILEHFPSLVRSPGVFSTTLSRLLRLILRERDFVAFAEEYPQLQGMDFVEQVLAYFDFDCQVRMNERARIPASGPVVIVANHPIGSLDGLALIIFPAGEVSRLGASSAQARLPFRLDAAQQRELAQLFNTGHYAGDFRLLKEQLQQMGLAVPTLYKQYTELCEEGGVQFLDFNIDPAFANCIDGLVVVDLQQVKPSRLQRYMGVA